jgi:hypothetical protein
MPPLAEAAPSRTECERVLMNDGFCHVDSRPPNPASATEAGDAPVDAPVVVRVSRARWIGGSPVHPATAERPPESTELTEAPESTTSAPVPPEASVAVTSPAEPPAGRPRNRSRNPTPQPPAPAAIAVSFARVTRDAISSA